MSESEQHLAVGLQIGDYLLTELVNVGLTTKTWHADQISVRRQVVIDSLNRDVQMDENIVTTFLSDVRTKAKVDHPLIGSVFEAVRQENICFYAREKLTGQTLEQMVQAGVKLTPEKVVHLIKQIADANYFLESHRVASLPLTPSQIFVSATGMCRLVNMAVGGERDYAVSTKDKHMLGTVFMQLLKEGEPGATRTKSLLGYMADLEREIPLTWEQIRELSEGVERQLKEQNEPLELQSNTMVLKKPTVNKKTVMAAGIALGALLAGGLALLFIMRDKPPVKRKLKGAVEVKAGRYQTFNGEHSFVKAFDVDAHEVTIAEYATFLQRVSKLDSQRIATYQHAQQPKYKTSYEPDDWKAMYQAAQKGEMWNGVKMNLNCPVVGVDWWDAYTYAAMNRRRLPTQSEWYAAIVSKGDKPSDLVPSPWGEVDQNSHDITKNGIYGLAGNVSEWTLKMTRPTHDPTATQKLPVICGASFRAQSGGATKREWVEKQRYNLNDPRDLRRRDLGFRTVGQQQSIN